MKRITETIRRGEPSITWQFKCNCGCDDFYRPKDIAYCISFFEGSFCCSHCDKEHDYYSYAFTRVSAPTQLELF